jgi:SAM-dependent methyltransferase
MRRLWSDAESAYRAQLLETLPAGNGTTEALDVGCDDGEWTDVVRRALAIPPAQVSGLEIVPARAELARKRGFDVRLGDLDEDWPFEDGSFDVVHANQVIEHVARLDHFAEETRRVLRPGGKVVVCTENLASWHNVAALTLGYQPFSLTNVSARRPIGNPLALHAGESNELESWQHVHVLSLIGLRDLFLANGFAIKKTWGAGYHPFGGRTATWLAAHDPRHAHFIGVVAEPRGAKIAPIAAALYVLLPFDVIPDFIPVVGHFDDAIIVTLAVFCVKRGWLDRIVRWFRRTMSTSGLAVASDRHS